MNNDEHGRRPAPWAGHVRRTPQAAQEARRGLYDLRLRTGQYALGVVRPSSALPKTAVAQVLVRQALHSGASVGAHCGEATRARSQAKFISKLQVVAQELDETAYWLEVMLDARLASDEGLADLLKETNALIAYCRVRSDSQAGQGHNERRQTQGTKRFGGGYPATLTEQAAHGSLIHHSSFTFLHSGLYTLDYHG